MKLVSAVVTIGCLLSVPCFAGGAQWRADRLRPVDGANQARPLRLNAAVERSSADGSFGTGTLVRIRRTPAIFNSGASGRPPEARVSISLDTYLPRGVAGAAPRDDRMRFVSRIVQEDQGVKGKVPWRTLQLESVRSSDGRKHLVGLTLDGNRLRLEHWAAPAAQSRAEVERRVGAGDILSTHEKIFTH